MYNAHKCVYFEKSLDKEVVDRLLNVKHLRKTCEDCIHQELIFNDNCKQFPDCEIDGDMADYINGIRNCPFSEELKRVLQETVGINVFEPDSYNGTGLGYGQSLALILKPGEQAESSLTFDVCSKETV